MNQNQCKSWVLGISYGHHESSCCLMSNTGDIKFIREEWLSRVKLDYRFPIQSIQFLKKYLNGSKIDKVVHFQKPLKNWLSIGTERNLTKENYLLKLRQFKKSDIFIEKDLKNALGQKFDLHYCPHHLSHALSSSFFAKKEPNRVYLVLDGYGDGLSGSIFDKEFKEIQSFSNEQSLGLVYSALTEWAGFSPNEDEYKIMALAAFGKPKHQEFIEKEILEFNHKNKLIINKKYFNFTDVSLSPIKKVFIKKFGKIDLNRKKDYKAHKDKLLCDVVCSFQKAIETTVIKIIQSILKKIPDTTQIICSGGLFHNSVMVGVIEDFFADLDIAVPPCPGDGGSSIGAAFFGLLKIDNNEIGMDKYSLPLTPFIGPQVDNLNSYTNLFKKVTTKSSSMSYAKNLLGNDECFGVYDSSFEIGPRALGARSLIANAKSKKAVKHLNEMIKQRESFRPLAVMLNEKNYDKIFGGVKIKSSNLLWMGRVCWSQNIGKSYSFLHHDLSSRPQLVSKNTSSYNQIPKILKDLVGEDFILANTSFNIAGDPMVFSAEDLYINCIRMNLKYVYSNNVFFEVINEDND